MLLGHRAWNTFLLSAFLVVLGAHALSRLVGGSSLFTAASAVAIFIVSETVRRLEARATAKGNVHVEGREIPRIRGMLPGNIDVLWRLIKMDSKEYCAETLRQWEARYGPTYDMNILWAHQIVTSDPTNIQEILVTKFSEFGKGTKFSEMMETFLGNSIFTTDGKDWKWHRTIARPFFSRERISDMNILDEHCAKLIKRLIAASETSQPVDIQDLFNRFAMDSISHLLFGFSMRTLELHSEAEKGYRSFVQAFGKLQEMCSRRIRIGSNWRIVEALSLAGDQTVVPSRTVGDFLEPVISEAQQRARMDGSTEESSNLLDFLVHECGDSKIVRDTLLSFLLAGRDTTASLLTFSLYALIMYPEVMSKLRVEVDSCIGQDGFLTPAKIQSMAYLRAVLNETLRLFPPVPMNIRRATTSTTLSSPLSKMGNLLIKKGTSVTYSPFLMQRRKDIWGEDAEDFRPERWLTKELPGADIEAQATPLHSAFVPFNAGQRLCLGKTFAYQECSFALVRLVQNFESFSLAGDVQPKESRPPSIWRTRDGRQNIEKCWPTSSITLYSKGGLWVRVARE